MYIVLCVLSDIRKYICTYVCVYVYTYVSGLRHNNAEPMRKETMRQRLTKWTVSTECMCHGILCTYIHAYVCISCMWHGVSTSSSYICMAMLIVHICSMYNTINYIYIVGNMAEFNISAVLSFCYSSLCDIIVTYFTLHGTTKVRQAFHG